MIQLKSEEDWASEAILELQGRELWTTGSGRRLDRESEDLGAKPGPSPCGCVNSGWPSHLSEHPRAIMGLDRGYFMISMQVLTVEVLRRGDAC